MALVGVQLLKFTFYFLLCLSFIELTSGANGVFSSGDDSTAIEGAEIEHCDVCLDEIQSRLSQLAFPPCNEVARLTECFEKCSLLSPQSSSNATDSIKQLGMFTDISEIFSMFKARNCEVYEDVAPGCNEEILNCFDSVLPRGPDMQIKEVNCTDEAFVSLLERTGNQPDCEWRSHLEMIASKGRRSACSSKNTCIAGGVIFLVSPGCESFRLAPLNNVSQLSGQRAQRTAPGTKFDVNICGQQHAAAVSC